MSLGVVVLGGNCPRGSCPIGVIVLGVVVPGIVVLEPSPTHYLDKGIHFF